MRIVLVSQEYPPARHGGIGAQNYQKAQGLGKCGHEIIVVTHSELGLSMESQEGRVRVIRVGCDVDRFPILSEEVRWLTYSLRVAETLHELSLQLQIDVVEFPEWGGEGYVHLLNRLETNKIPVVLQLHGPLVMFAHELEWPDRNSEFFRVGTHMESTCVRLADAVYSSSQCSVEWCRNHYGLKQQDVPVLHTGVDPNIFCPGIKAKEARPTIIFVGKLVENKGVLELAEAAKNLVSEFPDLQVWMFGKGEPAIIERLNAIAGQLQRADFLQLRGFISRDALPQMLNQAHVFAAPSVYEGGPGFVYLEAMSCALPVIACSGSGVSEIIKTEETGFLVPPKDVGALTEVLRRLLSDASLRNSSGMRAREYVLTEANSEACLKRLEKFYESVITRNKQSRPLL